MNEISHTGRKKNILLIHCYPKDTNKAEIFQKLHFYRF